MSSVSRDTPGKHYLYKNPYRPQSAPRYLRYLDEDILVLKLVLKVSKSRLDWAYLVRIREPCNPFRNQDMKFYWKEILLLDLRFCWKVVLFLLRGFTDLAL